MQPLMATLAVIREWQDLIAGLVGAVVLAWTVRWTLRSETRRRESDEASFRIALGTEIRQLGAAALNCYRRIFETLPGMPQSSSAPARGWLAAYAQLPQPVVYPGNADKVGSLGADAAFNVVFFYGQLALLADSVQKMAIIGNDAELPVTRSQAINVMIGLMQAADSAAKVLSDLQSPAWVEQDTQFKARVGSAISELEALGQRTS